MRPRRRITKDHARQVYRGRFHDVLTASGEPVKKDLMSIEDAEWKQLASGRRRRRSDAELDNLLAGRYETVRKELLTAQPRVKPLGPRKLSDAVQEWLDVVGKTRDEATVRHYSTSCTQLIECCGDFRIDKPPSGFSAQFVAALRQSGVSDQTVNSRVRDVQAFFNWSFREEVTPRKIKLEKLRATKTAPGIYSAAQMQDLLASIESSLDSAKTPQQRLSALNKRRAFWLLRYTGMRSGEVRSLPLAHIRGDHILLKDVPAAGFRIKGREEAVIPVAPALQDFLGNDLPSRSTDERFYLDDGSGIPYWREGSAMAKAFQKHNTALGITGIKPIHGFRATVASSLLNAGVSPVAVQALLRHANIQTTLGYHNPASLDLAKLLWTSQYYTTGEP